jgi:hypothetical protein
MIVQRSMEWLRAALSVFDERPAFLVTPTIQPVYRADVEWPINLRAINGSATPINGDTQISFGPQTSFPGHTTLQPTKAWRFLAINFTLGASRGVDGFYDYNGNFTAPTVQLYQGASGTNHKVLFTDFSVGGSGHLKLLTPEPYYVAAPARLTFVIRGALIADGNFSFELLYWEGDLNQRLFV